MTDDRRLTIIADLISMVERYEEIRSGLVEALEIIAAIGDGSRTVNSLPNIARIAREAIAKAEVR